MRGDTPGGRGGRWARGGRGHRRERRRGDRRRHGNRDGGADRRDRSLLVDASVFITLAEIGTLELLEGTAGEVVVPGAVAEEVTEDPAESALADGVDDGWIRVEHVDAVEDSHLDDAATHLGADDPSEEYRGDVALLALAMATEECVVVTDDKPLRETCKALSIPLSGSIGVLIRAVERGDLRADEAKSKLLAMDEVGARLNATLLRRAEAMIETATRDERGSWD